MPRLDAFGASLMEFENDNINSISSTMPGRSKTRKFLVHHDETTPNFRQALFPTQKQTLRTPCAPWSAPSRRQQTITQMQPFLPLYHPSQLQEDMCYEDDLNDISEEPVREMKRRKIVSEETPRRVTRSAKKQAAASAPSKKNKEVVKDTQNDKTGPMQTKKSMPPPPVTTKRPIRRVIPSSESTLGTPLSTRSQRSVRDTSRSPLKEKSTNIILSTPKPLSKARVMPLRTEVPDSMEYEDEISQMKDLERVVTDQSIKTMLGQEKENGNSDGPRLCEDQENERDYVTTSVRTRRLRMTERTINVKRQTHL